MVVENINAVVLPKPTHTHTYRKRKEEIAKKTLSLIHYIYMYICVKPVEHFTLQYMATSCGNITFVRWKLCRFLSKLHSRQTKQEM